MKNSTQQSDQEGDQSFEEPTTFGLLNRQKTVDEIKNHLFDQDQHLKQIYFDLDGLREQKKSKKDELIQYLLMKYSELQRLKLQMNTNISYNDAATPSGMSRDHSQSQTPTIQDRRYHFANNSIYESPKLSALDSNMISGSQNPIDIMFLQNIKSQFLMLRKQVEKDLINKRQLAQCLRKQGNQHQFEDKIAQQYQTPQEIKDNQAINTNQRASRKAQSPKKKLIRKQKGKSRTPEVRAKKSAHIEIRLEDYESANELNEKMGQTSKSLIVNSFQSINLIESISNGQRDSIKERSLRNTQTLSEIKEIGQQVHPTINILPVQRDSYNTEQIAHNLQNLKRPSSENLSSQNITPDQKPQTNNQNQEDEQHSDSSFNKQFKTYQESLEIKMRRLGVRYKRNLIGNKSTSQIQGLMERQDSSHLNVLERISMKKQQNLRSTNVSINPQQHRQLSIKNNTAEFSEQPSQIIQNYGDQNSFRRYTQRPQRPFSRQQNDISIQNSYFSKSKSSVEVKLDEFKTQNTLLGDQNNQLVNHSQNQTPIMQDQFWIVRVNKLLKEKQQLLKQNLKNFYEISKTQDENYQLKKQLRQQEEVITIDQNVVATNLTNNYDDQMN
eukprot:403360898